jgi:uncharacterized protein (DUF302 family)
MCAATAKHEGNGVVSVRSQHSFADTMLRLERMIATKELKIFAVIDHSGEADAVGLRMPSTKLVIFGSPTLGTPIMLAAPSAALDLPLRVLVAEDPGAQTWISYNSPAYVAKRHSISDELIHNIAGIEAIVNAVAG